MVVLLGAVMIVSLSRMMNLTGPRNEVGCLAIVDPPKRESFGAMKLLNKGQLASTLIPAIEECMEQNRRAHHA